MAKALTPEDGQEYQRLHGEYVLAMNRAFEMAALYGWDSKEHAESDAKAGEIWVKMRKLRSEPQGHWMS